MSAQFNSGHYAAWNMEMQKFHAGLLFFGIGLSAAGCAAGPRLVAEQPESIFACYLAQDEARTNWSAATIEAQTVYVSSEPILTDADLEWARPYVRPHGLIVDLKLRPNAADRLRTITAENVGRRVAIYVASDLRAAPVIRSMLGHVNGMVQVSLELERDQAEKLASTIRERWPAE